ncbi:MAG: PDZ domain-containing protein [Verrucomicrobiae bacterium]|nr:PDZ domain-containing protein [Verrucomicrobiae bacterium]
MATLARAGVGRRAFWCVVALGVPLLFPTGCATTGGRTALSQAELDRVIAKVRPALVRIRVVTTDYFEGREVKMQAVGSGAIITRDGYLITNHHVAGHAVRVFCTLWNREEIEAEVVGTDALTDITVLRLKPDKPMEFTPVPFGDSARLRVGDPVLAMGSPMALSQSVTLGIISNTEMIMPRFWGPFAQLRLDGEDVGSLVKWIGHDAPIYGGNSGGPLVNLRGEIVGINEIKFGLGGAIPSNLAKAVAEELIARGKVRRSWLGVDVQPRFKRAGPSAPGAVGVAANAASGSAAEAGVLIGGVLPDSPAERAGLKAGDLLLSLAGQPVDVRYDEQMPDFMRLASGLPIGQPVPLRVLRDGRELALQITPAEREDRLPKPKEIKPWGLTARNLSSLLAREMKRPHTNGVVITSVRPGGPSGDAKPPLSERDVLVAVNDTPVRNVEELLALTQKLTAGQHEPVPVVATFERKDKRYLTIVRVGIEELKDPGLEVTKAWLPVETQVITRPIARQLGQPDLKGFYLTRVYPNSTAEKAGLRVGDFIVAVDGEKLTASGAEHEDELSSLIRQYDVGRTVELTVLRGNATLKIPVELVRSPRLPREMKSYRNEDFEFTARDISFFDRAEQQWPETQTGALVTDVKRGSWAELGALYVDDLIVEVDGRPVADVDALRREMERVTTARQSPVIMKVLRGIHTKYLELEPNWKN